MTKPHIELGGINIGTSQQKNSQRPNVQTSNNFHALILGDFSGAITPTEDLKVLQIDRDNFDEILEKINPKLNLDLGKGHSLDLAFKELEDFEPDALYENLEVFAQLRSLRRRLSSQTLYADAVEEMKQWQNQTAPTEATEIQSITEELSAQELLNATLTETTSREPTTGLSIDDNLAKILIRDIIAPHILPKKDPKQTEYITSVDNAISETMNNILHHPQFQALEGSWRGLYSLIKRTITDNHLKFFIVDFDKEHLHNDVNIDDLSQSLVYKKLVEPYTFTTNAKSWSVWFGDYTISDNVNDVVFLERMGTLAEQANITFISTASSQVVSCESLALTPDSDDWQATRNEDVKKAWSYLHDSTQSKHLALTFPRILARLPYGKKTRSASSFDYEEMPETNHDNYLWSNAGYALLTMLAESFSLNKWEFLPGEVNEIDNLPVHVYEDEGDKETKPCAEILLTEKGAEIIKNHGIIPVWSIKQQDKVRIGPMISLHSAPQLILGHWLIKS